MCAKAAPSRPEASHAGEDSEENKLDAFKSKFEEHSSQEDAEHGRPIDPLGPTPLPLGTRPVAAPGASPSKTELLGNNPKPGGSRWNTDLPGGRPEAEALFERLRGDSQTLRDIDEQGNERIWTEDNSVRLRIMANGDIRVERQVDIGGKRLETIHFGERKGRR